MPSESENGESLINMTCDEPLSPSSASASTSLSSGGPDAGPPAKVLSSAGSNEISQAAYHLLSVLQTDLHSCPELTVAPQGLLQLESVIRSHCVATLYHGHEKHAGLANEGSEENVSEIFSCFMPYDKNVS